MLSLLRFFILSGILLIGSSGDPSQAQPWIDFSSQRPEQEWYHQLFKRLSPRLIHRLGDSLELGAALKASPIDRSKILRILERNQARTLDEFIMKLNVWMTPDLDAWIQARAQQESGSLTKRDVEQLRRTYLSRKISVEEFLVAFDFYRWLGLAPDSLFLRLRPENPGDLARVRRVKSIILWPYTPIRKHGENRPKLNWETSDWAQIFARFKRFGVEHFFDELYSQLVNPESGSATTRHIAGFEDHFIFRCLQLSESDPHRAIGLLQAYLLTDKVYVAAQQVPDQNSDVERFGSARLFSYLSGLRRKRDIQSFFALKKPQEFLETTAEIPMIIRRVLESGPGESLFYPRSCAGQVARAKPVGRSPKD